MPLFGLFLPLVFSRLLAANNWYNGAHHQRALA
jgi:hypothetical protein